MQAEAAPGTAAPESASAASSQEHQRPPRQRSRRGRGGRGRGRGREADEGGGSGRGGGRGGVRGGGRGGGDHAGKRLSKKLSWALRHGSQELGLDMSPDGYVLLSDLLTKKGFSGTSVTVVQDVVATDDKQRFALKEEGGSLHIRANQGHSVMTVDADQLLTPVTSAADAPVCVHGTFKRAWRDIVASGALLPMGRTHVHFAAFIPPAIEARRHAAAAAAAEAEEDGAAAAAVAVSGLRGNCQVLVHADVARALNGGVRLWRSANGVLLADTLPLTYVSLAEDLTRGGAVLWRDGAPAGGGDAVPGGV